MLKKLTLKALAESSRGNTIRVTADDTREAAQQVRTGGRMSASAVRHRAQRIARQRGNTAR